MAFIHYAHPARPRQCQAKRGSEPVYFVHSRKFALGQVLLFPGHALGHAPRMKLSFHGAVRTTT
ncbi:MAG TPA: hypothetical protein QF373_01450, partial [Verrucomicrobiota bacterium]|nr:hypothetical protein [Verrucomicrobiota bacterium]